MVCRKWGQTVGRVKYLTLPDGCAQEVPCVMDEREKSSDFLSKWFLSDSILLRKLGQGSFFFSLLAREKMHTADDAEMGFGHGRRERKRERKEKKRESSGPYYGVARDCMVRYSDGASPRQRQHPCTWKVFIFNRPHVLIYLFFFCTQMNQHFTIICFLFLFVSNPFSF